MGAWFCKPRKRINVSSLIGNENENPFEISFSKKERTCIRETYLRLIDPKELIGQIFADIVNDLCPEFKKVFGVDRVPKASMLKMPKFGGHISRITDFYEQLTSMIGFTENLLGAWQLVRKTGRLHAKVAFLGENLNHLEKNYFVIVDDVFIDKLIPYLTGAQLEPDYESIIAADAEKKKVIRFAQNYSQTFIIDVWRRLFNILSSQLTESFEFERHKCLNVENQKTLAPHQKTEQAEEKKRRQNAERQSEIENSNTVIGRKEEELLEDPF